MGPEFRRHDDPTDVLRDPLGNSDGDERYFEQSGGAKVNVMLGSSWSYNFAGLYQVMPESPWGFNIGGSLEGREGYATAVYDRVGGPLGNRQVQLTGIEAFRQDDLRVVNFHLDKEFKIGESSLVLALDGFNMTNEDIVLQTERRLDFGRANQTEELLSPRVFRLGATFRFR